MHRRSPSLRAARLILAAGLVAPAPFAQADAVEISPAGAALLHRALGSDAEPAEPGHGRELFETVLASDAFRSGAVGCLDVHVLAGGAAAESPAGGKSAASGKSAKKQPAAAPAPSRSAVREAEKLRDALLKGLAPAADVVARYWPAGVGAGLISGTRFPIVIAEDRDAYLQLVALLDHCERAGYSGWAPANALDVAAVRGAEVACTWEVQVFNLSHPVIAGRRKEWLEHGAGYYSLAFVANRALRLGAWGLVPPWLSAGLTDELDITAYGRAWVGQESWTCQTPGWSRSGWSGFVPQGSRPPPPVSGPPADLAVTVSKTGDPWLSFEASESRHWDELRADLKTEAPASFARAAETESFLPRDRAAARCLMHLLLAETSAPALTARLDRAARTPAHGMSDSEPLPVLFAAALGGVAEVDRLEALDSRTLLGELGRLDLAEVLEAAGAADALALTDHREQAAWLYGHPCDAVTRQSLFTAFLEIEYLQQMAEWKAIAPRLDSGMRAALEASRVYPKKDSATAEAALRDAVASPEAEKDPAPRGRRPGRP